MKAFCFIGYSGSGKTTLLEKLIPRVVARGLRVSLIKHTHHNFDVDKPGKDSYRLREAGCSEVMLLSNTRWALMHELRGEPEPGLADQLSVLSPCDLVLVEGYKTAAMPKIEVFRPALGKPMIYPDCEVQIVALASSEALSLPIPCLPLHDYDTITQFMLNQVGLL